MISVGWWSLPLIKVIVCDTDNIMTTHILSCFFLVRLELT
jgi:hypothetical protein